MKKLFLTIIMALPLLSSAQEMVDANNIAKTDSNSFKMYPNPAYGDEVYITTSENGNKEIKVFDVFGETVLKEQLATNTLNISKLLPGVYVLQVVENEKTMTRKLVKK